MSQGTGVDAGARDRARADRLRGVASEAIIAAVDLGTSSVKVALVTTSGTTLATAQADYPTQTGPNGEREQNPADWWSATVAALTKALAGANAGAGAGANAGAESGVALHDRIVALSATGQMQDLICTDASGVLRSTLLYSDTRAGTQHERLLAAFPDWAARTGNLQDSSNVAAKLAWLAEHEPDVVKNTTSFLFSAAGYLLWRAGGEAACDLATASVTGLLDTRRRDWFHELVAHSGALSAQLPRLVQGSRTGAAHSGPAHSGPAYSGTAQAGSTPDSIVGTLSAEAATELGLPAGISLVLAMGDAAATTDGLVGTEPGDAYLYLGTTGWFAQVVDAGAGAHLAEVTPGEEPPPPSAQHALVLPGWQQRLRIGAVLSAGASSAWALATFLPGRSFAEADELAGARLDARLPGQLLCLPGLNGERTPVRDNSARGSFVGITDQTDAVDLYLAVLTGVAMGLRHAADEMREAAAGAHPARIALVGGASVSPVWRRILASVFETPIVTRGPGGTRAEPGAISAAALAADALGLEHSILPVFARPSDTEQVTRPGPEAVLYRELLPIHRALYDTLGPTFQALSRL
jgi:xylulokinase